MCKCRYKYKYKYKHLCCQEVYSGDNAYGGGERGSREENVSAGVNLKEIIGNTENLSCF